MSPTVYAVFEEICAAAQIGGPVLEVGAVTGRDSLLGMTCLQGASARIGINQQSAAAGDGWETVHGNAHRMDAFDDGQFAAVLCNATLEHDPQFWLTVAEIKRVTASGGLVIIGVPGFAGMGVHTFAPRRPLQRRVLALVARATRSDVLLAGTVTLGEHHFPRDYYRFSEQAMREVLLAGLTGVGVRTVMHPPRFIGWGRKP